MAPTTRYRNDSSAATSSQFSSTPSPGSVARSFSLWNNDSHATLIDEDVTDNAPRNIAADRSVLPQQISTTQKTTSRFIMTEDGSHEHNIHDTKGLGKSLSMVYHLKEQRVLHLASKWMKGLHKEERSPAGKASITDTIDQTLAEKYGRIGHVLGSGAFGTVRIAHKINPKDGSEQLFAVKQLLQRQNESSKKYHKRLTSEFRISSALRHPNIVRTLDLLQDAKHVHCQVMEYCPGGDLHTIIHGASSLEEKESDCFFKQLMQGILYMHEMGIAHRDLKPENILLTHCGTLKIADFGSAECFRTAWETEAQLTHGICGSAPYIAPEVYTTKRFDARAADVWAAGCVYMAMRTGGRMWCEARVERDPAYAKYVVARKTEAGYKVLEDLRRITCRNVIYSTLDPKSTRRLTADQVLCSEWMRGVECCEAGRCVW